MTVVLDASAFVAALVDGGPTGRWAEAVIEANPLAAPHLLPVEATSIVRRAALVGEIGDEAASLAHAAVTTLPVELFTYEPFSARVWELRATVTSYDAWYVALAEALDAPLATLDVKLSRAPGVRCSFLLPT